MSDPINFRIAELFARYELHPDRRDVFVEGEQDRALLRAYLESEQCHDVLVLPVSVVDIPTALILSKGLPHPSRRSAVITLAMELEIQGIKPRQAVCVADADMEYLVSSGLKCTLLLLTDYTSMELYGYTSEYIHSLLIIVAPNTISTGSDIVQDLSGPLQFLFSARAVNVILQLGLSWIDAIDKFFGIESGRIKFNESEFLNRYVINRVRSEISEKFASKLVDVQSLLSSDTRCRIRGHDFIQILTWYLRTFQRCKHLTDDTVRQMLYISIRPHELRTQPMFASLRERMTAAASL
jgi:hypothetical protein